MSVGGRHGDMLMFEAAYARTRRQIRLAKENQDQRPGSSPDGRPDALVAHRRIRLRIPMSHEMVMAVVQDCERYDWYLISRKKLLVKHCFSSGRFTSLDWDVSTCAVVLGRGCNVPSPRVVSPCLIAQKHHHAAPLLLPRCTSRTYSLLLVLQPPTLASP